MWETLSNQIKTTIEAVTNVKEVFTEHKTKLTKFPCVYLEPLTLDNSFETNNENAAVYAFQIIVIVGGGNLTDANANLYLMRTVDAIITKINATWNQGTIDGHRVVSRLSTTDRPQQDSTQDGLTLYWPLVLEVKLLTDI